MEQSTEFLVVDENFEPILGLETCISFGLIKRLDGNSVARVESREEFIKNNKDIFSGLRKIYILFHYKKRISIIAKTENRFRKYTNKVD